MALPAITHVASFISLAVGASLVLGCFCCPPHGFTSSGEICQASELGDQGSERIRVETARPL